MAKKEAVMEVVEPVIEEVVETVETLERIPKFWLNGTTKKQQVVILGFTAVVPAAIAAFAAWKISEKRTTFRYEKILSDEIAETKAFYQRLSKEPLETLAARIDDGREAAEEAQGVVDAVEALRTYEGTAPLVGTESIPEEVTHNIFVEGKPMDTDFDYEAEIANRSEDKPYIISYEEFTAGEKDYTQNTLTWYEGDDTLTDDKDQPIPDSDMVVGDENLQRFGHGSKDSRIVYVRNDVMELDFEVLKNPGAYAQAVLGFTHSDRPGSRKVPRYRGDDG